MKVVRGRAAGCSSSEREAILFAAGELPASEIAAFERHLAECASCAAAVGDFRAVERIARAAPVRHVSSATFAALAEAARRSPERKVVRAQVWRRAAGWAVAASLVLAGGAMVIRYRSAETPIAVPRVTHSMPVRTPAVKPAPAPASALDPAPHVGQVADPWDDDVAMAVDEAITVESRPLPEFWTEPNDDALGVEFLTLNGAIEKLENEIDQF